MRDVRRAGEFPSRGSGTSHSFNFASYSVWASTSAAAAFLQICQLPLLHTQIFLGHILQSRFTN